MLVRSPTMQHVGIQSTSYSLYFEPYAIGTLTDEETEAQRGKKAQGHLGGSVVERVPLAQVVIPGSWD